MRMILKLLYKIIDICFPPTCACCENFIEKRGLCKNCWEKIKWLTEPLCEICGKPVETQGEICVDCIKHKPYFDKAIAVFSYESFSKKMILKFKNEDGTYLAVLFAEWINRIIQNLTYEIDLIIPVPISFFRRLVRKYNQTELLAQELHKLSNIAYEPRVLEKKRKTSQQKELKKLFRLKNVKESFGINSKYRKMVSGRVVLLIDDVITTGATANECARQLKLAGALKVYVATIARVDLKSS